MKNYCKIYPYKDVITSLLKKKTKQIQYESKALRNSICILYALWKKEGGSNSPRLFYEYLTDEVPLANEPTDYRFINLINKWVIKYGVHRFIEQIAPVIRYTPTVKGLEVTLVKYANTWLDEIERGETKKYTIETDVITPFLRRNKNKIPLSLVNLECQAHLTANQYGGKMNRVLDFYGEDKHGYHWIIEIKSKNFDRGLAGQVIEYKKTAEEDLRRLGLDRKKIKIAVIAPGFRRDNFMRIEHPRYYKFFVFDMEHECLREYKVPERFGKLESSKFDYPSDDDAA